MRTGPWAAGAARRVLAFIGRVLASTLAFIRREVAVYSSYRAKLTLGLASLLLSLLTFSFVGKVVASSGPGFVERYGMSYTSFAVTGVFVHSLAASGLYAFRSAVRREQLQGTLEMLFTTGLPAPVLVALAGAGEMLLKVVGGAVLMVAAAALIGLDLRLTPELAAALVLYLLVMCGAGLASAGVVLVSKEGEPVSWALGAAAGLMGGVYFPVDLLPAWLASLARALPTTHALALARSAASGDAPACGFSLAYLLTAAAVSLLAGSAVLGWGCRRAGRDGTLSHY